MPIYIKLLVFGDFVTFAPPLISDAGSYWCRNKTNRSDIAEGKLIYKGISLSTVVRDNRDQQGKLWLL